jgi:hypothetical protein
MAVLLATRRAPLASTRREETHCQHRSSRGKVDVLTTPTWPHDVHSIRSIMGVAPIDPAGTEKAADDTHQGLSLRRRRGEKPEMIPPPR